MKLKISVTQEDIDKGVCGDGSYCPIALAMKRIPGISFINADGGDTVFTMGGFMYRIVDRGMTIFINHFDRCEYVEPIEFEVEAEEIEYDWNF